MEKYILSLMFVICTSFSYAFKMEANKWYDFEGKISDSDIQLSFFLFKDGSVKGNYYFLKNGIKIEINGKVKDNEIELTETGKGKPNGYFKGRIFSDTRDRYEGVWTDNNRKKSENFELKLTSSNSASYEHRYYFLYGDNAEVEGFASRVRASILEKNKKWLAENIYYPIKVSFEHGPKITIETPKEFIENFDRIFYTGFLDKIKEVVPYNLYSNHQGAMLKDGIIWINNTKNSNRKKYGFCITSINN